MIRVTHVRRARKFFYIGRKWAEFEESPYHNPFHIGKDGDRPEVLLKFAIYWYAPEQKKLRDRAVQELSQLQPDGFVGCWCYPQFCHGDIVAGYVNWKLRQETLF